MTAILLLVIPGKAVLANTYFNLNDEIEQVKAIVNGTCQLVLFVIAAFFFIRMMMAVISGQIDFIGGKPGAFAELLQGSVWMLVTLVLAINIPLIANSMGALFSGQIDKLGAGVTDPTNPLGVVGAVLQPIATFFMRITIVMAFSVTTIAIGFGILKSQLSVMFGAPGGLVEGIKTAGGTFLVLMLGVIVMFVGSKLLSGG